jgi:hypothetical protein
MLSASLNLVGLAKNAAVHFSAIIAAYPNIGVTFSNIINSAPLLASVSNKRITRTKQTY